MLPRSLGHGRWRAVQPSPSPDEEAPARRDTVPRDPCSDYTVFPGLSYFPGGEGLGWAVGRLPLLGARDPCHPQGPSLCWPIQPVQRELSVRPFPEGAGPVTSPAGHTPSAVLRDGEACGHRGAPAESRGGHSCPIPSRCHPRHYAGRDQNCETLGLHPHGSRRGRGSNLGSRPPRAGAGHRGEWPFSGRGSPHSPQIPFS